MIFNICMKLYFSDILELNYSSLVKYIFNFSLSSTYYTAMNILIDKSFFTGTIYYVLRIVSYKWNNKVGGV